MRIYCLSDLHMGYEKANYPKIIELFDLVKTKADKLILCGDILDLWRNKVGEIKKGDETKDAFAALLSVADEVDTTYVWGNHDYKVEKKFRENNITFNVKFTDRFELDDIYYCHGWRFDVQQRAAHVLYDWLVTRFPWFYQTFFKTPYELMDEEERYTLLSRSIHAEAKEFIRQKGVKYLIMGHTHDPLKDGKLVDCGDMVDSLSYVVIENGVPGEPKRMSHA